MHSVHYTPKLKYPTNDFLSFHHEGWIDKAIHSKCEWTLKKEKLTKIGQVLTGHDVIQLSQSYVLASKVNPFLHQMFPLILTITTPCATDAHNTRYPTNTFLDALASFRSITLQKT